jgi:myo-inositol 2-dehydrogenase/D-chiro-inositol 1-dehydrogenase
MATKVNVGLIGTGRIGKIHAENLVYQIPAANLLMVTDAILENAQSCAAALKIPTIAPSPQAIFADKTIDAVIICSSTRTHAPFIIEAARAGKHIFCEKPIALNLAEIDQALEVVKQSGIKLQVGFNRRFDSNFKQAHDMVAAGKIGTPHVVRITSRDPAPPPLDYIKVSGGIFLDMTIHDFDMARYLIQDEVEEVYAAGEVMVDPAIGEAGDIDTAVITLRYSNGAIGIIDNSRRAVYGYDQRVEVFGSEGGITVSNNTPHQAILSDVNGVHAALPLYFFLERYKQAFVAEMSAFIEAIQQDTAPPVTGSDGRIPVVMGLAAWKSYQENRPVKLTEIDPQ